MKGSSLQDRIFTIQMFDKGNPDESLVRKVMNLKLLNRNHGRLTAENISYLMA